jgi:hypothetical protein
MGHPQRTLAHFYIVVIRIESLAVLTPPSHSPDTSIGVVYRDNLAEAARAVSHVAHPRQERPDSD